MISTQNNGADLSAAPLASGVQLALAPEALQNTGENGILLPVERAGCGPVRARLSDRLSTLR